ncbi:hypothetical protein [Gordoniibacillus kamchatkensis]|uniref:hypothetical protein n=1 Tax=Gordoniibacillus kamchatkensis TaxID=1590651 RepID=UPI0018CD423C|nr:hypothetical protein [Paenibacillus sp. VKM B-2647]
MDLVHSNEGYVLQTGPGFSDLELLREFMSRTDEIDERNVGEGDQLLRTSNGLLFRGKDYVWSLGSHPRYPFSRHRFAA